MNGHVGLKYIYVRIFRHTDRMGKRDWVSLGSWIGIGLACWIIAWIISEAIPTFSDLLSLIVRCPVVHFELQFTNGFNRAPSLLLGSVVSINYENIVSDFLFRILISSSWTWWYLLASFELWAVFQLAQKNCLDHYQCPYCRNWRCDCKHSYYARYPRLMSNLSNSAVSVFTSRAKPSTITREAARLLARIRFDFVLRLMVTCQFGLYAWIGMVMNELIGVG